MTQVIRFDDLYKLNKKELEKLGAQHSNALLENNEAVVLMVKARKAMAYLDGYIKMLDSPTRENLMNYDDDQVSIYGCDVSLGSTGDRLDYEKDETYLEMKTRLKDREALLKLAFKSKDVIYDSDAAEVERVPVKTPSKEILKLKL